MSEIIIDCKKIQRNIAKLFAATSSPICAIVKANAYGHGLPAIREISRHCDALGVATNEEALELVAAGIHSPIIVIGAFSERLLDEVIQCGISFTCDSEGAIRSAHLLARRVEKLAKIHIKVDTGMNRLGVPYNSLFKILAFAEGKNVAVEGVFSHFSCSDSDIAYTEQQFLRFCSVTSLLDCVCHMANSSAFLLSSKYHLDMSRVGIALYGGCAGFEPALTLKSSVAAIKEVAAGEMVGYSGAFVAQRTTTIAIVSIGYADGIPRHLSNKGSVIINGAKYPIVGNICMDLLMVDISSDCGTIEVGSAVYLLCESYTVLDMARDANTISYEILTRLGNRPRRIYINEWGGVNEQKYDKKANIGRNIQNFPQISK